MFQAQATKQKTGKEQPTPPDLQEEPMLEAEVDGPLKHICEYEEVSEKQQKSIATFHLDWIVLKNKRSPQVKVVEFMIMKLFSQQTIFYLIDILFKDMADDYKLIEGADDESSSQSSGSSDASSDDGRRSEA